MSFTLATWNINSVRLRLDQIARFVAEQAPDVLCLQEIKCQNGEFPTEAFEAMAAGDIHGKVVLTAQ
jgi:exodeoxyribonuclease-3